MTSTTFVCEELSNTPAVHLSSRLHSFIADAVCKVFGHRFGHQANLNSPPKDQVLFRELTNPLQWMLFGGDPNVISSTFENQGTPSNFCGKVFKGGEPAYFCKDCQTDPTCCLCMECFEHSEHKTHKYRLFASGGGGCCDCGDPEAWTSGVHCELHEPTPQNEEEVDPIEGLPPYLADRAKKFFTALLWYCMNILSSGDNHSLPTELQIGMSAERLHRDSCLAFLYNDEIHSYDEVIHTLTHNISMTHTEAVALATYVDRKGRAVIKQGTRKECEDILNKINRDVRPPLKAEMYHVIVSAHQDCANICLSLLKELAEKAGSFRRIISQALVDVSYYGAGNSVLDKFFLCDSSLWITARISWHRLVMSSIFMDTSFKKQLAITLSTNYNQLQKNFVADSHHHDVCASNMTVQIFTAPSLSRMLVLEHGLLSVILKTLQDLLAPCRDPTTGCLRLRADNYKHSRIFYIIYDLRYVLRTKPERWTDDLRIKVIHAYNCLLELLSWLQNAEPVRRQRQQHVEREEPWEHCFNFNVVMQPAILFFMEWCISDATVLQEAITATFKKHELIGLKKAKLRFKSHNCVESMVGRQSMELIIFDILKEPVSIHQPFPRMIAMLLTGANKHGKTIPQLLGIPPDDSRVPLFLMEYCSRSIVMAVQVMAGMWKRNGYSVVNQIINYQYHHSREIMYDKDILMLQSMASILDPNIFLYSLVYKFRLEKWLLNPDSDPSKRGEPAEDALKFFISEAEEFLFLLITIFTERYTYGVGEGMNRNSALRRELIHRLFISSLTHSEIVKQFRLNENENEVDAILKEVASLRRMPGSGGKFVFELKPEYEENCSPFYYHYTKPDHSKAEEIYRKRNKATTAASKATASPPVRPPPFTPPYNGIMRLAQSPVLHRMLHSILKQAATPDSKFWSDKLLHEAIYLYAMVLAEEDSSHHQSLCNAAIGRQSYLPDLEVLASGQRAEEHRSLLNWCIEHLHNVQFRLSGCPMEIDGSSSKDDKDASGMTDAEREAQEKKDKALERRADLMVQISAMQKKFLEEHREELDQVDSGPLRSGTFAPNNYHHERAVGMDALVYHDPFPVPSTCILCQEETKDFASQEKPYVQAVYVQRSAVLRKREQEEETDGNICVHSDMDFISSREDLLHGMFTSGCGHHMHAECWKSFLENKRIEHARHHFFPLPGQSVEWEMGEFLCPLCQCYSNTVLPLFPQVGQLSVRVESAKPRRQVDMKEWRELITLALTFEHGDSMDTGSSVDLTVLDKLEDIFPEYKRPTQLCAASHEDKVMANIQEVFSQSIFMRAYGVNPDVADERVCLAQWNNCAYSISSLEYNSRLQDKFLLSADTLTSRQLNTIRSLVRLGSESRIRPEISAQIKHLQYLINCFLLEGPAFSEMPSILDLDCFSMLVNLHFAISGLFISISSPYGYCAPLEGDPVILPLMGLTDSHLIKLTAAAHLLQYLLTCSPAMEQDSFNESCTQDLELTDGIGLQQLWIKYRKIANLSYDSPPSPNDLCVCVQQHMYPFLQRSALFFYCLSGVAIIHSSATTVTHFEDLCKYVGLPSDLHLLFDAGPKDVLGDKTAAQLISSIAQNWCTNPVIQKLVQSPKELPILKTPRHLLELPHSYSELLKRAAAFQCSKRLVDQTYGDDGQAAMLCLICGQLLCTNSYCCQMEVEGAEGDKTRLGGFAQHVRKCGVGVGMALWIQESYVVLLDATDIHNVKGCTLTPPYLDEYGETDPGLSRGSPLFLNKELYMELQQVWFYHRIPERIRKDMEGNRDLMRIRWDHM